MTYKLLYTLTLSLLFCTQHHKAAAMEKLKEHVSITFNNHPDDTEIVLNGGVIKITPTRKNVTVKGVKEVKIQILAGALLAHYTIKKLQETKEITVIKDQETGAHTIIRR